MTSSRPARHLPAAALVATAALLAACSTSSDDDSAATAAPVTTAAPAETTAGTTEGTEPAETTAETTTTEAGPPEDLVIGFDLSSGDINATRDKYGVGGQNTNLLSEDYYVALMDAYNAAGGIAGHLLVPLNYTPPTGDVSCT